MPRMTKERLKILRIAASAGMDEALDEIEACWAERENGLHVRFTESREAFGAIGEEALQMLEAAGSGWIRELLEGAPGSLTDPNKEGAAC